MTSDTPRAAAAANVRAAAAHKTPPVRQAQLAAVLGISQQAMSRRLTGEIAFNVDELHAVATFLDVPVAALLPEPVSA